MRSGSFRFKLPAKLAVLLLLLLLGGGLGRYITAAPPPAPDFDLPQLKGGSLRLSSLHGRPVLLNFFATWCRSCRQEAPVLAAAARRWAGRVRVVGIDLAVSDSPRALQEFVSRHRLEYPILLDRTGAVSRRYLVRALPTTVLIGKRGELLARRVGALGERDLGRWVGESLP